MPQLRPGGHCKAVTTDPAVIEAPKPVLTSVQDIGIQSGAVVNGATIQTVQNTAPSNGGAILGGQNHVDYHVSLDMAKELAMVERTDKGREARQYFIQCEKNLTEAAPLTASLRIPL